MPLYKVADTSSQGILVAQIFPSIVYSTGGTWVSTPTNLSNITDGDESTSTTEGQAGGVGSQCGYINLDLGVEVGWLHGALKIGCRNDYRTNQPANWGLEASNNNINWVTVLGATKYVPGATEAIVTGNFTIRDTTRFLRFFGQDTSTGAPRLKVYSLK